MFFCSSGFWDRFPLFPHVQFDGEGCGDGELIFRPVSRKRRSLSVFTITNKTAWQNKCLRSIGFENLSWIWPFLDTSVDERIHQIDIFKFRMLTSFWGYKQRKWLNVKLAIMLNCNTSKVAFCSASPLGKDKTCSREHARAVRFPCLGSHALCGLLEDQFWLKYKA